MDFAPYQSSPPEQGRALSPPVASPLRTSPRASFENPFRRPFSPSSRPGGGGASPPPLQHPQPRRSWQPAIAGGYPSEVSEFDTSLGIGLEYEAALVYLALPPLGAILFLVLERKSDYVRWVARAAPRGGAVVCSVDRARGSSSSAVLGGLLVPAQSCNTPAAQRARHR